jgi:hypothetical protein
VLVDGCLFRFEEGESGFMENGGDGKHATTSVTVLGCLLKIYRFEISRFSGKPSACEVRAFRQKTATEPNLFSGAETRKFHFGTGCSCEEASRATKQALPFRFRINYRVLRPGKGTFTGIVSVRKLPLGVPLERIPNL